MEKKELEINVGPLSSFNSLNLYVAPQLDILREDYAHGRQTIPIWDLRNISPKGVSISALVAFLSISKRIRDFIGHPISLLTVWQPEFQGFLADIGFVRIAKAFDLYKWPIEFGGYKTGSTNPNTKIFFYSDLPGDLENQYERNEWKDLKRQEIKHSMLLRLTNLFDSKYFRESWSKHLEAVLTITGSELIVNSLLHGNSVAFVGVQRTAKRITTCVCDSGMGFVRSLKRSHPEVDRKFDHGDALLFSSVLSKNKIGLYRAIDDVVKSGGYVIMSSFDAEIRWEDKIWKLAKYKLEEKGLKGMRLTDLGEAIDGYVDQKIVYDGYYKQHSSFLIGSRITFELPLY